MNDISQDIEALLDKAQSGNLSERSEAVTMLASSGSEESIAGLVIALEDQDGGVRELAADALSQMHGELTGALLSEFLGVENITTRNLAAEILIKIGGDAVEGLIVHIESPDHDVRKFVVDVLGLIGDERAVEPICSALWDENSNVCCSAAEALGLIGDPSATEPLIAAAEKIADLRPQVAEALGCLRDTRAVEYLISLLSSDDPLLMYTATEALGKIGSPAALKSLSEIINSDSIEIAGEAFRSALKIADSVNVDLVSHITGERMRSFILDGLISGDTDVLRYSLQNPELWNDSGLVKGALDHAAEMPEGVRQELFSQLRKMRSPLRAPLMAAIEVATDNKKLLLLDILSLFVSQEDVQSIVSYGNDSDERVREKAAKILGQIGDEAVLKSLNKLCRDSVGHVRSEAFRAMGWVGSSDSIDELIEGLDDKYPDVRDACVGALVTIGGQQVIDHFTADLNNTIPERQRLAVRALGWIGEDSSVAPLLSALGNSDPRVRKEALVALSRLGAAPELDQLKILVNDENDSVRQVALTVMASRSPKDAIEVISWFLQGDEMWIKIHAVSTLKDIGGEEANTLLQRVAQNDGGATQLAAISALAEIGDPGVKEFFRSLSGAESSDVREALARVLESDEGSDSDEKA